MLPRNALLPIHPVEPAHGTKEGDQKRHVQYTRLNGENGGWMSGGDVVAEEDPLTMSGAEGGGGSSAVETEMG